MISSSVRERRSIKDVLGHAALPGPRGMKPISSQQTYKSDLRHAALRSPRMIPIRSQHICTNTPAESMEVVLRSAALSPGITIRDDVHQRKNGKRRSSCGKVDMLSTMELTMTTCAACLCTFKYTCAWSHTYSGCRKEVTLFHKA